MECFPHSCWLVAISEAGWPASQGPWNSLGYEEGADAEWGVWG